MGHSGRAPVTKARRTWEERERAIGELEGGWEEPEAVSMLPGAAESRPGHRWSVVTDRG